MLKGIMANLTPHLPRPPRSACLYAATLRYKLGQFLTEPFITTAMVTGVAGACQPAASGPKRVNAMVTASTAASPASAAATYRPRAEVFLSGGVCEVARC